MSQSVDAFRTNCEVVPVNSCRDDPEAGRSLPNRAKGRSSRKLATSRSVSSTNCRNCALLAPWSMGRAGDCPSSTALPVGPFEREDGCRTPSCNLPFCCVAGVERTSRFSIDDKSPSHSAIAPGASENIQCWILASNGLLGSNPIRRSHSASNNGNLPPDPRLAPIYPC
jgi:hypothetical protein